ncbi:MAG: hypothetical protein NW223_01430 [Hyphomicrobiaceae bacterium]|nr:hypothetical protein [Hyphomicrobiaceae bacterium]
MSSLIRASTALAIGALALAGCASDGNNGFFTTGALGTGTETTAAAAPPAPKVDPQCVALISRIETLRKEGITEKIEKAAAKKYKMTAADASKADQLNKANVEFQARCSTITPGATTAQAMPSAKPATN